MIDGCDASCQRIEAGHRSLGKIHHRLVSGAGRRVEQHQERFPRNDGIGSRVKDEFFGRLVERDGHEPKRGGKLLLLLNDIDGRTNFIGIERVKRVMGFTVRRDTVSIHRPLLGCLGWGSDLG